MGRRELSETEKRAELQAATPDALLKSLETKFYYDPTMDDPRFSDCIPYRLVASPDTLQSQSPRAVIHELVDKRIPTFDLHQLSAVDKRITAMASDCSEMIGPAYAQAFLEIGKALGAQQSRLEGK